MENQHRKIKGYREPTESEIDAMNEVKEIAAAVRELTERMRTNVELDQRWVAVGVTDLQKGFMALTRSIAKPDFF